MSLDVDKRGQRISESLVHFLKEWRWGGAGYFCIHNFLFLGCCSVLLSFDAWGTKGGYYTCKAGKRGLDLRNLEKVLLHGAKTSSNWRRLLQMGQYPRVTMLRLRSEKGRRLTFLLII